MRDGERNQRRDVRLDLAGGDHGQKQARWARRAASVDRIAIVERIVDLNPRGHACYSVPTPSPSLRREIDRSRF